MINFDKEEPLTLWHADGQRWADILTSGRSFIHCAMNIHTSLARTGTIMLAKAEEEEGRRRGKDEAPLSYPFFRKEVFWLTALTAPSSIFDEAPFFNHISYEETLDEMEALAEHHAAVLYDSPADGHRCAVIHLEALTKIHEQPLLTTLRAPAPLAEARDWEWETFKLSERQLRKIMSAHRC